MMLSWMLSAGRHSNSWPRSNAVVREYNAILLSPPFFPLSISPSPHTALQQPTPYMGWEPSTTEIDLLRQNPKRRKVEYGSTVGKQPLVWLCQEDFSSMTIRCKPCVLVGRGMYCFAYEVPMMTFCPLYEVAMMTFCPLYEVAMVTFCPLYEVAMVTF